MDKQKLAYIFKSAADYFTALHQTDYRHGFDKGYSIPSYVAKWLESNAFREVRIREYTINEHKFYAFATSEDFDDKDNFTTFVGFINHTLHAGNLSESDLQPVELLSDYLRG